MIFRFLKRILQVSGKHGTNIRQSFVFSILESICQKVPIGLAAITIIKLMNQELSPSDSFLIFAVLVISVVLQMIFHYINDQLQSDAGYRVFADLRVSLADHLRKLPMGYYTAGNIGKLSSVLSSDMMFIEENVMRTISQVANYLFNTMILVVFSFVLDYRLGLVVTITLIIYYFLIEQLAKASLDEGQIKQQQNEKLTNEVLFFLDGIAVMKSFNRLGRSSKSLRSTFEKSKQITLDMESIFTRNLGKVYILLATSTSILLGMSFYLYDSGIFSVEYLLALTLFYLGLFIPLKALSGDVALFAIMDACLDRINEVFNVEVLEDKGEKVVPQDSNNLAEIEFENVSFGYDTNLVLNNISFKLAPKTITALVGPSGSGKSTIANLLARFWDVQQGKIKIRGTDIKDIPLADLMDSMSVVFQQTYLFQDTILNNIKLGHPKATREQVIEAAKKARCYDFIEEFPDGLDTVIGEGGESLSGGQRQRISIARCIFKDAPIIILDEATASVDADNEYYIQQAISELVKNKTLLIIAHRLNTIKSADKILVIHHGNVVEEGTHDELVKLNNLYSKLFRLNSPI